MKKLLIIILTVAILLSTIALVGCKEDENNIYGIIVSKPPDKLNYYAGETLDISGCEILVKTRDRNDYTVKVTPQMVSGFSSALGNHTLTITYTVNQTAFVTTQTITVTTRKAKSATITQNPTNTTFVEGQTIDLSGLIAEVKFSDNSIQDRPFSAFTLNKTVAEMGLTEVELKLDNAKITVPITVIQKKLVGLRITKMPDKTVYTEGECFNPEGMVVYTLYNDGELGNIITYEVINKDTPLVASQSFVTIKNKYSSEFTVDVPITVNANSIDCITLDTSHIRTDYLVDTIPDFENIQAEIKFTSGETKTVGVDSLLFNIPLNEPLSEGVKTVVVKYKYATNSDIEASFDITVSKDKKPISIKVTITSSFISTYADGDTISLIGLEVAIIFNDGNEVWAIYGEEVNSTLDGFTYTLTADSQNPYIEFKLDELSERIEITVKE